MTDTEPTILAVHSGALGDVVLLGRLLAALDGTVTLLAGGEKGRLLEGMGVVARSLDFDALPMHEVFSDAPPDSCALPGLLGVHERLVSCFAAGDRRAELRLAAMCGAGGAAFLPIRPDPDADCHLLEVWSDMLGVRAVRDAPWPVPPAWTEDATVALAHLGLPAPDRCAVIHPGAGAVDKCWPLEQFLALAGRIDRPAVFVLGPVELDRWPGETIDRLRREVPLLVCPPLTTLAAMLARADVFIGNDSGASHLAAAVGTPTVALFGPTSPEHFAPRGRRVVTPRAEPISRIDVSRVAADVERIVDGDG